MKRTHTGQKPEDHGETSLLKTVGSMKSKFTFIVPSTTTNSIYHVLDVNCELGTMLRFP